jgi:hypothetical protein
MSCSQQFGNASRVMGMTEGDLQVRMFVGASVPTRMFVGTNVFCYQQSSSLLFLAIKAGVQVQMCVGMRECLISNLALSCIVARF